MGEYLNCQGYTVCGIRLAGHATRLKDMVRSRWQDWLLSVEDGIDLLRACTDHTFLLGLSMGGILSLTAAARFKVRGVVAMSTPFDLPATPLPRWVFHVMSWFKPYVPKGKVPGQRLVRPGGLQTARGLPDEPGALCHRVEIADQ